MHENSLLLFEKYALSVFLPRMRVLELGPDSNPSTYEKRVNDDSLVWETLDIRQTQRKSILSTVTHVAEEDCRFPLASQSFDVVLACQVIEHVRKVWRWIEEIARICRPGGTIIIIGPVTWPYHEDPVDCWRIYPEGMRALCEEGGLEPILIACEGLEPMIDLRKKRWFLLKQFVKSFIGREPFLAPLTPARAPTLDTITIAKKR